MVAALGMLVLAQSIYRAVHQSITHDEACTYNWFITEPANLFNYDPNNHVLFTYLAMAAVKVLGASTLTLRLPALLGAVLYVGAVLALVRRAVSSVSWAGMTGALLLLNPLVLDYLAAARGYGLALACLLWAVWLTPAALHGSEPARRRRWFGASLALGLCVASSLAFALIAACLAGTAVAAVWMRRRSGADEGSIVPMWAPLPGLGVALAAYLPLAVKVLISHAAAGRPGLARQLARLGALARQPSFPGALPQPAPWVVLAASGVAMSLLAAAVLVAMRLARGNPLRRASRARRHALWAGGCLALAAVVTLAGPAGRFGHHLARRYLYIGSRDATRGVATIFAASFAHDSVGTQEEPAPTVRLGDEASAVVSIVAGALAVAMAVLAVQLLRHTRRRDLEGSETARLEATLLVGSLSLATLLYTAAHIVIGLHVPPPRAALYVVPLASGGLALALYSWQPRPKALAGIAALAAIAVVARYVQQWNPEYFWGTISDANSRAVFERISTLAPVVPHRPVRVGGSWLFEPAMNFYRQTRRAVWMAPYERVAVPTADDYDFFICRGAEVGRLRRRGWTVAYHGPVGDVSLMQRPPPG